MSKRASARMIRRGPMLVAMSVLAIMTSTAAGWSAAKHIGTGLKRGTTGVKIGSALSESECTKLGGTVEWDSKCPLILSMAGGKRVHCNVLGSTVCINENR
jgi:hypothetical protein